MESKGVWMLELSTDWAVAKAVGTSPPPPSQVLHGPGRKVTSGVGSPVYRMGLRSSPVDVVCFSRAVTHLRRVFVLSFTHSNLAWVTSPARQRMAAPEGLICNPLSLNGFSSTAVSFLEL